MRSFKAVVVAVSLAIAMLVQVAPTRDSVGAAEPDRVTSVDLKLVGTHNLASPGWDGEIKPRGQNGDVAVLDNPNGRAAFVAGGARFHGLWSVTSGRVCTDYGGVKVVDLDQLASPAGIIDIADTKSVLTGPIGNPRRGLFLKNISSSASSVDALSFTSGPAAGKDILAVATQRCEPSFFNGARLEFWDVTDRSNPTLAGVFDPESIPNPTPGAMPANGQWGIFEDVRLFSRNNGPGGSLRYYAVATTPFSIGNSHDASFAGDLRVIEVTNPSAPAQLATFPNSNIASVSDNGCRTFHGGRAAAPTPDGSHAILSWYDGPKPEQADFDSPNTAAVLNIDLDNIPVAAPGNTFPKTFSPTPPVWGYPVGSPGGETIEGTIEGNAADVQPFTGPGGELLTFVSEDDVDPGLTNFSVSAPASLADAGKRACQIGISKHAHSFPGQQLTGDAVYVGRACPASQMVNDTLPEPDPLLADPNGKLAIVESGGSNFNQCGTMDKIRRLTSVGATGVLLNLGGDFLSVHIPGQDGDIPAIPAVGIQATSYNKMAGYIPNRVLSGTVFPTTWNRSSTTNVQVKPNALAVTAATNASPIVITAASHGLVTGDRVAIAGVTGNTAANGTWTVTVVNATTFSLDGSTGNGAFTGGGSGIVCPSSNPNCTHAPRRTDFARFRSVANATDPVARGEVAAANRFAVIPGQAYTAGVFVEVEDRTAGAFEAEVVWYDATGAPLAENGIVTLSAVAPRSRHLQTISAPVGAATGSVRFEWTGGGQGTAFADTFSFVPVGLGVKVKDHPGECPGMTVWPPAPDPCTAPKAAVGAQRIIDFSRPTPAEIGTFRTPRSQAWPPPDDGIYVPSQARMFGDKLAFTAWHSDGLRVLDVSDPRAPREVGSFVPPAVVDPSPDAGAGPSNRIGATGTCGTGSNAVAVACMKRGRSWPDQPLVTSVAVIPSGTDSGLVVLSDINAGLYVLSFKVNRGSLLPADQPAAPTASSAKTDGYWLVAADGGIFSFGDAPFLGSTGDIKLNKPIVGITPTPTGRGYWMVATDGGVFSFGDAGFFGSTGDLTLNKPIVGMAATPTGKGYWLVASDGGVFGFGDADFHGSTGSLSLNSPVVGMASTPSGAGYRLVAGDGGIFSFGDADFYGSTGNLRLTNPIVGMASTSSGDGYWLVASDGGVFSFGDAGFFGSTGNIALNKPVVGIVPSASQAGYRLVATDGGIFAFGDATFLGSTGDLSLNQPVVGIAART